MTSPRAPQGEQDRRKGPDSTRVLGLLERLAEVGPKPRTHVQGGTSHISTPQMTSPSPMVPPTDSLTRLTAKHQANFRRLVQGVLHNSLTSQRGPSSTLLKRTTLLTALVCEQLRRTPEHQHQHQHPCLADLSTSPLPDSNLEIPRPQDGLKIWPATQLLYAAPHSTSHLTSIHPH